MHSTEEIIEHFHCLLYRCNAYTLWQFSCGVFKWRLQNWIDYCLWINNWRKFLNFEFGIMGSCQKRAKILLSKSIFSVKNHPDLSIFFSLKNTNLGTHYLLLTFFDGSNFQIILLLKWCPIFDSWLLIQNSKFNNILWVQVVQSSDHILNNISSVVEFQRWWVLKSKIFA